MYNSF